MSTEKVGILAEKELQSHFEFCSKKAAEISRLMQITNDMINGEITDEVLEECPELAPMFKEAGKLKYRKVILERALKEQLESHKADGCSLQSGTTTVSKGGNDPNTSGDSNVKKRSKADATMSDSPSTKKYNYVIVRDYGSSILGRLNDIFKRAIEEAFPTIDRVPVSLTEATNIKFGDYQCNSAMAISAKLKATGTLKRPSDVAAEIKSKISPCDLIEKIEVVPAGYINIFLNKSHIEKLIGDIAAKGVQLPQLAKKKVVVDFSSPNIAKEMHVGHLRSTIIGDSICRLLETVGFDVLRINHIGDWGTQFGMLIAYLYDKYPNFINQPPPISDLQTFYKESKKQFDEDAEFKRRAYDFVVKLQSYDPEVVNAWTLICNISKKFNQMVYERLDIRIEDVGESFYQKMMIELVSDLKNMQRNNIREEEGRLLYFPANCPVPLTIVKSDGGYTYDTSDMAALRYRLQNKNADWVIYVVDAGQSLHFEAIFSAARELGWYDESEQRVEHVPFGLVLGEDRKKFKTRSGDTVRLLDLLDEGLKRATAKLDEKGRAEVMNERELAAARDAVAYGCIKYSDLSHTRTQDYIFSFDRMLDDKGNTAVYLLYAYARIRSIVRTSGVDAQAIEDFINRTPVIPITHPAELKLSKQILKLSDCILQVLDSLMPHQLCDYLYQLATTFHDFYNVCYVIENKQNGTVVNFNRLVLCEVTANVMSTCFKILGIPEVPRM
ncbi:putative arginine--tRNA ligase, cytoplasmic [Parelaphostrongylus tenuis]|uniref:Probable arginine--tRNA ligase, cytoplasmic n=1 Tax=Parelaphostrongylus tenuis TaxID=148309 RepID=A0AAD5M2B7_PARTN|nr:putative arginine--tRNA ligase, cytoplasmic [Parelaphostrongylus tenuis]